MNQRDIFVATEGGQWLKRNETKLTGENDPVIEAIDKYRIKPKRVFEIGCANGWRLKLLKKRFKTALCGGIDPGCTEAISRGPAIIEFGTAEKLDFPSQSFDLIIYGWCLYLTDIEDYLRIAMEGDRVLKDNGYLIVYDFHADYPYKTPYKHKDGLFSHHNDFSKLWLSHPAYSLYGRTIQGETSVTILHKDMKNAFPVQK
jgi:ubiquinone/menaquinone biosynthesis C-methylase UbiE